MFYFVWYILQTIMGYIIQNMEMSKSLILIVCDMNS